MDQSSKSENQKNKFRIGGREEVIAILYDRGDSARMIAERYELSLSIVENAIKRCSHRYKRSNIID
jgi:hypothetical protein